MAGFSLPSHCIPEWASAISEEEWKNKLLSRLGQTQAAPTNMDSDTEENNAIKGVRAVSEDSKQPDSGASSLSAEEEEMREEMEDKT